jgi:anti-sigma factor (TIGR02949 family)
MGDCGCGKCEELLQPYLDRELTDAEVVEAEAHLAACDWCARRYRFETTLRRYVRQCCEEPMSLGLKERLLELRSSFL